MYNIDWTFKVIKTLNTVPEEDSNDLRVGIAREGVTLLHQKLLQIAVVRNDA